MFKQAYENDLESDLESIEGEPEIERQRSRSPIAVRQTARETWELLRQRGRLNRQVRACLNQFDKWLTCCPE